MALTTLEGIASALRQRVMFRKGGILNNAAGVWSSCTSGNIGVPPAASTLSATTSGAVPVAGDTGYPTLMPFSGDGRILSVEATYLDVNYWLRAMIYDRVFHCGEYSFLSASQTLSSQPSFSGRLPGGSYNGLLLYVEAISTLGSGTTSTVTITYTNQSGTGSRTAAVTQAGTGFTTGQHRMIPVPLQSGDCGVQSIDAVSATGSLNSTFNVVIARPLWYGNMLLGRPNILDPLDVAGLPEIYPTSAIGLMMNPIASQQAPAGSDIEIEIVSG